MWDRILCVAAHPDDDVIGMGGFLSAMSTAKETIITILYMSNGVGSRDNSIDGEVEKRMHAMDLANLIMGVDSYEVGLFEDQRFDQYPIIDLTKWVEKFVMDFKPTSVFTHSSTDLNRDHRCTHEAVITACRPLPESTIKAITCFEVASATEWGVRPFVPTLFLGGDVTKKRAALKCYSDELRPMPHPRNIDSLITMGCMRGISVGKPFAEAFELVRMVIA